MSEMNAAFAGVSNVLSLHFKGGHVECVDEYGFEVIFSRSPVLRRLERLKSPPLRLGPNHARRGNISLLR